MKKIKFITTFSDNGYQVYGKSWIESFLEFTKDYDNISAKVYVNNMDLSKLNYPSKVEIVDFDVDIPQHKEWISLFQSNTKHDNWNKNLAIKFSFKSFVMINELKHNDDCYVIWLDADSIFKSYEFDNFPESLIDNKFIACQKESGSEHVESGIIIFDSEHSDKQRFIDKLESFYMTPKEFNAFGQFFDGFAIRRTLNHILIDVVDLNEGYGIGGIQSDPNRTFMNPEIKKRFHHNIGITGKRSYKNWQDYAKKDKFFQLIHGVNEKTPEEIKKENLANIKNKLNEFKRFRR